MIAALLLAVAATAVPSPPTPTAYVTDTQSVLSAQTVQSLDAELAAYERATGHQIVVYVGDTTGDEPLEQWTVDTAERWGIGHRGHDDGAVLFVLMKDRKVRIEVGYGLEPSLTDAQLFWIVENTILPKMRAGDVDGAIRDGVDRMLTTITPSYASQLGHSVTPARSENENEGPSGLLLGLIIFLCFFWIVLLVVFVAGIRYVVTLLTRGPAAAAKAWHDTWIASGTAHRSMWYGGGAFFGGFGGGMGGGFGGFSAGGGGFGGGGASGGW